MAKVIHNADIEVLGTALITTAANGTGNFVTRNTSTNVLQVRTPAQAAADIDAVTVSGNQTITGVKTFDAVTTFNTITNFLNYQVFDPVATIGGVTGDNSLGFKTGNIFTITQAGGTFEADFNINGLTADRAYTLPDTSGTLALLSDISADATIYTGDGSLSGTRTVTMAANPLTFSMTGGDVQLNAGRLGVGEDVFGASRLGDNVFQATAIDTTSVNLKGASQATTLAMFSVAVGGGTGYTTTMKNFVDDVHVISVNGVGTSTYGGVSRQVEATVGLRNDFTGGQFRVLDLFNNDYDAATDVAEAQGLVAIHGGGATAKEIGIWRYDTTTYTQVLGISASNVVTWSFDVNVPDEVYGVAWDGSTEVPTKNAIYDKIESIDPTGDYLLLSGASTMLGNLDVGGQWITDVDQLRFSDTDADTGIWSIREITNANYVGDLAVGHIGVYYYAFSQTGTPTQPNHLVPKSYVDGLGFVDTSGTPVNNQVAVFTDANTVEGHTGFTYDSATNLLVLGGELEAEFISLSNTGSITPLNMANSTAAGYAPGNGTGALYFIEDAVYFATSTSISSSSSNNFGFTFNGLSARNEVTVTDSDLTYNGTSLLNSNVSISNLSDTTITGAAKGDILVYNGTAWVDLTVGSNTQVLTANSATSTGLEWAAAGGGASVLNDLTDVVITAATTGEFLRYNGTNWVDTVLTLGDIPDLSTQYVTIDTAQTVDGSKTFAESVVIDTNLGAVNGSVSYLGMAFADGVATVGGGSNTGHLYFQSNGDFSISTNTASTIRHARFNMQGLTASTPRTYTLQDADGTLAFTSDIPAGAGDNIYNTNGSLTGARAVTMGTNQLTWEGTGGTIYMNSGRLGVQTEVFGGTRLGDSEFQSVNIDTQSILFKNNAQATVGSLFMNPSFDTFTIKNFNGEDNFIEVTANDLDDTNASRSGNLELGLTFNYTDTGLHSLKLFNNDVGTTPGTIGDKMGILMQIDGTFQSEKEFWFGRFDGTVYDPVFTVTTANVFTAQTNFNMNSFELQNVGETNINGGLTVDTFLFMPTLATGFAGANTGSIYYDTDDSNVYVGQGAGAYTQLAYITDVPVGGTDYVSKTAGGTFDADISVPDEVYGVAWNGSLEVPTKNAVYDKIESLGGGGATVLNDLTDVTITAAATGEYLRYNGSAWVDSTIQAADIPTLTDYVAVTGDTMTGNLTFNLGSNIGILMGADSQRMLIGGGTAWSGTNGAYIEVQGIDYGGVGLGGDINMQIPSGGRLYSSQQITTAGNEVEIQGASPRVDFVETGGTQNWNILVDTDSLDIRRNGTSNTMMRFNSGGGVTFLPLSGSSVGVNIDIPALTNYWALRADTNGANFSGLYFNGSDGRLLLRDSAGNINVDLNSNGVSLFQGGRVDFDSDGGSYPNLTSITDGGILLRFQTDRPWSFRQRSTGASTALQLYAESTGKRFEIGGTVLPTAFYVEGDTGDVDTQGTLTVAGATDLNSTLDVAGNTVFSGNSATTDVYGVSRWFVSSSDTAHQRADARDDATTQSRLHWYGVTDTGGTTNFKHAWYDGSAYIDVTAENGGVSWNSNDGGDTIYRFSAGNGGMCYLDLRADEDNNLETDVPQMRFYRDGGARGMLLGLEGNAGQTFTGSIANSGFVQSEVELAMVVGTEKIAHFDSLSLTFEANNILNHNGTQSRDKIRVWSSSLYTIGMKSGYTFGSLNTDYAMSFQMNNDNDRGFWWGDDQHTDAQGAMSLTTNGKLTVATGIRVGYGESDTTILGTTYDIQVSGDVQAADFVLASDERLKQDIDILGESFSGWDWVSFRYKNDTERLRYGAIAQKVEKNHPDMVRTEDNEEEYKSLSYTDMLVKETIEQNKIIREQDARIERLELIVKELLKDK